MKLIATVVLLLLVGQNKSLNDDSVLLQNIQALTLYRSRYTKAVRSSPIPQLKCVGGSAGCKAFIPDVVQCVNKGWDGLDVQWECRTDMDNAYRFGHIEVSCEGFSHPADEYILKGSCGLEYTLDLTEEGKRRAQGSTGSPSGFRGFMSNFFSGFSGNGYSYHQQSSFPSHSKDSGGLLVVAVLMLLAYGVYKLFLSGNTVLRRQDGGTAGFPRDNYYGSTAGPHPPGFKPDITGYPGTNTSYGFHNETQDSYRPAYPGRPDAPSTGGGFWTGMGTGGVLGYLFGRQRSQCYNSDHSSNNRCHLATDPTSSPGTRTATGFGGTKRR